MRGETNWTWEGSGQHGEGSGRFGKLRKGLGRSLAGRSGQQKADAMVETGRGTGGRRRKYYVHMSIRQLGVCGIHVKTPC